MNSTKNEKKLTTPTALGDEARQELTGVLNHIIADAFALFIKTKNFHWHVSGSHYRDYHLLFDEQAAQIFASIDVLAERVRKLGGTTIRSIQHINELKGIRDDNDEYVEPKEMLRRLIDDNQHVVEAMRTAHNMCDEYNDIATASFLEVFIDEGERRIWFLYETQA